jgi:outer membrane lipoprotein-sorting protein
MRRRLGRGQLAAIALLTGTALTLNAGLSAQPVTDAVPAGKPLPTIVPLPPLPPLPKEGVVASIGAPKSIAPPAAVQSVTPARVDPATPGGLSVAQRTAVERVNGYFNSVSTLVGNFVQVGPDRKRLEGDFYLQKPGKVRFDYDPPSPVELIADGSSVVVRDRKLATQDLYPLSQTPLRFLLAEKLDLLKDTNIIGVYQDDLFINVVIEEKHPLVGTHRLMLMFGAKDSELKQWTITDPQGYDTTIAIFNLNQKDKPDPSLFKIDYTRRTP